MIGVMDRWATFDCYGTLIDWNGGIGRELERLFGVEHSRGCCTGITSSNAPTSESVRLRAIARCSPSRSAASPSARLPLAAGDERCARRVASVLGGVSRRAGGARGRARPRLETCDSLQHRSRLHRRIAGAHRRAVRACDRRLRDRLVQTGAQALGIVRGQDRADATRTFMSGRASTTTSLRQPSSACGPSGSTGSAKTQTRSRMSSSTR